MSTPMNFVYLSPNFPPNFVPFVEALHRHGARVLGIAAEPYEQLDPRVRAALTEYFRVESMESYDQVLRACGYFTHKYGKLDRVESHNEHWLTLEGALREDFNIFGKKRAETEVIRRKSKMKQVFLDAGIKVARGVLATSLEEALAFGGEVGYPLIAKPDQGVGAMGTHKICSAGELDALWESIAGQDYFLEEFLDAELYSFDGMTNHQGTVVFWNALYFSEGIMDAVNQERDLSYHSFREIPPALFKAGMKAAQAFDIREKFFHIEFLLPKGKKTFHGMEVNVRPPGGLTTDLFNFQCDFDIYDRWAKMVVSGVSAIDWEHKWWTAYVGRKHSLHYRHSLDEVAAHFPAEVMARQPIPGIFRSAIGDEGVIVRSVDLDHLKQIIAFIHEKEFSMG